MKIHKWIAQSAKLAKREVRGRRVRFQDQDAQFYTVDFRAKGRRKRRLIFRVAEWRQWLDRFHWWFCRERIWVNFHSSYDAWRVRASTDAEVARWMETHYWTMQQKGHPLAKRWLRAIDPVEYERQAKQAKPRRWRLDFETMMVMKVRGRST